MEAAPSQEQTPPLMWRRRFELTEAREILVQLRLLRDEFPDRFIQIGEEAASFGVLFTMEVFERTTDGTVEKVFELKPSDRLKKLLAASRTDDWQNFRDR